MHFRAYRLAALFAPSVLVFSAFPAVAADPANADRYQAYLTRCQADHICNGTYVVARNGKILFAGAFGDAGDTARTPLTIDNSFDIGSIAKQFTAMAVLRLVAAGQISLDGKVAAYLPRFPYADITVAQLLSHTSGIADAMPYYTDMIRKGAVKPPITGADIVSVLADNDMPAAAPPGARYAYSNTGYMVLAALVERTAGRPFEAYLDQSFFKPLGMKDTRLRTPDNESMISHRAFGFAAAVVGDRRTVDQYPGLYMRGAGGIYSTAPDLLRWENALNAGRVIPQRLLALATTPAKLTDGSTVPYGFGLSLKPDASGARRISHGGHWRAFKSDLSYYPLSGVTIIQLTNNNQDDSVDANAAALSTIADGGTPPPLPGPIGWALADKLADDKTAQSWFETQLSENPKRYDIQEAELNNLGYAYLKQKDTARAVRVFKLETLAFPGSANAFDSLADAYEASGDTKNAYASVQSAAALAPSSAAYAKRAEALKARLP